MDTTIAFTIFYRLKAIKISGDGARVVKKWINGQNLILLERPYTLSTWILSKIYGVLYPEEYIRRGKKEVYNLIVLRPLLLSLKVPDLLLPLKILAINFTLRQAVCLQLLWMKEGVPIIKLPSNWSTYVKKNVEFLLYT